MNSCLGFLALSLLLWGPQLGKAQQTPDSAAPARNAEITIRGCVSGQNRYTLMQASTGAAFQLTGDTARFASVRGKLIEAKGNEYPPQPNSSELPKLSVTDFHVIADHCPIQAHAEPRTATSPQSGQGHAGAKSPATAPYQDPGTVSQRPPNVNNPNIQGDTGSPSPGTGNTPQPHQ